MASTLVADAVEQAGRDWVQLHETRARSMIAGADFRQLRRDAVIAVLAAVAAEKNESGRPRRRIFVALLALPLLLALAVWWGRRRYAGPEPGAEDLASSATEEAVAARTSPDPEPAIHPIESRREPDGSV